MRTIQANGPYLIGGYSFGACVAVEMALQLTSVRHLLLLDGSHAYVAAHTKQYRTKFTEPKDAEAAVVSCCLITSRMLYYRYDVDVMVF
jgi:fatty acid synthase, animal type